MMPALKLVRCMNKILLIGPQGSGKGTQAELLSRYLGIPAFAMGQLLRDEVAAQTAIGERVRAILDRGDLVSDTVAAEVLQHRLAKSDTKQGYILDGYPRNMDQYAVFTFDVPTHVFVLEVPREESVKRLSGRLTCRLCDRVYSRFDGHKEGEACACGGKLMVRSDDTEEAINRRLDVFEHDTRPVIQAYEQRGLVHRINGVGSVEDIQQQLIQALEASLS